MNFTVRLDRPTEKRIRDRIKDLAQDPMDLRFSAPLKGHTDLRKARVGPWRIIFTADLVRRTVDVLHVEPRGQVYDRL